MYLIHDDYKTMGGTLDIQGFTRKEFAARAMIDRITNGRIQNGIEDSTAEKLRFLVLELIEQSLLGNMKGRERSSESGVTGSVSYVDDKNAAERLIRTYLAGEANKDGVPLIPPSIQTAKVLRT